MPSIKGLAMGFQKENPRLYEALCEIERRLSAVAGGGVGSFNYCRVYSSAGLTIATATPTLLAFDRTRVQTTGMHDDNSLNTRITIQTEGFHTIHGHIQWPVNAVGTRLLEILVNGGTVIARELINAPSAAGAEDQNINTGYYFSAGDYVELRVTQTSGGNLIIPANNNYSPEFAVSL